MSMGGLFGKPKKPIPPANQPMNADASVKVAGDRGGVTGYNSFISTSSQGLTRKPTTRKSSLISGGST